MENENAVTVFERLTKLLVITLLSLLQQHRNTTFSIGSTLLSYCPPSPGTIEIPVLRHGSDLSSLTSVWCATRPSDPPSASPGVDYIPSSKKVEFKAGRTVEVGFSAPSVPMCADTAEPDNVIDMTRTAHLKLCVLHIRLAA